MAAEAQPRAVKVARVAHPDFGRIAVGRADDQPAVLRRRELQHQVGGDLVGRVLLGAEQRDLEQVEDGVAGFVKDRIEERPDQRVRTADGRGPRPGIRRIPELRQELVADDDLGILIRGVRIAAATLDFEPQRARPAEHAEAIAHALERLLLLEQVAQEIMFSIGRIGVVDRDAILTRGLRLCGGRAERKNDEQRCQTCDGPVHAR